MDEKFNRTTILICAPGAAYEPTLVSYLKARGYAVQTARAEADLKQMLEQSQPDLVLLGLSSHDANCCDPLVRLRSLSDVPCIVLADATDSTDRIVHLELGADGDIDRSVSPRELLARIRALLRRSRGRVRQAMARPADHPPAPPRGWRLVAGRRELWRPDGTLCPLTSTEFSLLQTLHDASGTPLTRESLMRKVFGRPHAAGDRSVDALIRKVRQKIDPDNPELVIKTVRSVGYVFVGFPDPEQAAQHSDAPNGQRS